MRQEERCGIAMYTIHKSAQKDLYETFCRLGAMGYHGIEFYGEPEADLELLHHALRDSALRLTGWHVEWRNLQQDRFRDTVRYLQRAECPVAVVPCLGGKWQIGHSAKEECREVWLRYTEWMNDVCGKLKTEGIRLGYHNHEHEFALQYDGRTVFELLFDAFSEEIIMEFDSGNCIEGGGKPLEVLKRYQNREMILHLKPYSHTAGFQTVLGAKDDANDWKALLCAPERTYRWLLVESENESLPELENAERCLKGLKEVLKDR